MLVCCFICVFAVLVNKVSLQETVEALIGGSVVLRCSSTEHDHKLQDIDVSWRHNGSKNVFDIINGQDSLEQQHPRYKNRTETFPDEYLRGNFSIKLNNLTHDDAGKYICFISSEQRTVQLRLNESTAKGNKSHDQRDQGEETEADNVGASLAWVSAVVVVVLLVVVAVIVYQFSVQRKKKQALASDTTEGETTQITCQV
ncbi:hypothetical protein ABG768_001768 [Culter alburnus]|uniref:Ig-like domain-containing protein n=1 Tax=Culter alburnus TaxID=194366 RepID=A0AAW2A1K9_CULAL